MINNYNQSINVSASSTIDGEPVLYMVASVKNGEPPVINTAYQNMDLYKENREQVDADFEEFKNRVFAIS